jgi:hypothetical protein
MRREREQGMVLGVGVCESPDRLINAEPRRRIQWRITFPTKKESGGLKESC